MFRNQSKAEKKFKGIFIASTTSRLCGNLVGLILRVSGGKVLDVERGTYF